MLNNVIISIFLMSRLIIVYGLLGCLSSCELLLVQILCMTCINNHNGVTIYCVSIIPFVGICHIEIFPSANGRSAAWQRALYGINGEKSIAYIALHVFIGIRMAILLSYVSVERTNLGGSTFGIEILILHPSCRRCP